MKKEFCLENYVGKYVMNCTTEEEAIEFTRYLHDHGMNWNTGDSYLYINNWNVYGKNTAYFFNEGTYAFTDYAKLTGYKVLYYQDFYFVDNEDECDLSEFIEEL